MTALITGLGDALARSWAFFLRDFRETASYRLSFVMQAYSTFFSVTLFYFISGVFGQAVTPTLNPYGGQYFPFVLVGLAFLGFMSAGMMIFSATIRQGQMTGTLEAMLVTPTSLSAILLSSSLWAYARSAINVGLYLAIGVFFGLDLSHANWISLFLVVAISVAAFAGLGIISASFVLAFKRGNPVASLFGALSGLLSGVYFPVAHLPEWLRAIAKFLPLTYALDGTRRALLLGDGPVAIAGDLLALAAFAATILPLAIFAFRLAVRHAKREGSLSWY